MHDDARNAGPYSSFPRNNQMVEASAVTHRKKYVIRRPNLFPASAAAIVPTQAPAANQICVHSRDCSSPFVNWEAQAGAHCVDPQVPNNAIPERPAATSIRRMI